MAYEIVNSRRASSIIRCEGASTVNVTLDNLSTNTSLETVSSASIRRILWSTGGTVTVGRGASPNTILTLYGTGDMKFDELGYSIANGAGGNIVVTIATGGTCVMEVSKIATYSTDLDQL